MKKQLLTFAIVLGLGVTTFANPGGMFQRGTTDEEYSGTSYFIRNGGTPMLPNHGASDNQNAPLGSGIAVFMGLGASYLVAKRRKQE